MRVLRWLRGWFAYLILPLAFIVVAAGFAIVERGKVQPQGHLRQRTAAGGVPRLQAEMLGSLSGVLLEVYPDRAESNRFAGVWSAERGDLEEARRYFRRAVEIDPRDGQLLFWYGQTLVLLDADRAELDRVARILARHFPTLFDELEAFAVARARNARVPR